MSQTCCYYSVQKNAVKYKKDMLEISLFLRDKKVNYEMCYQIFVVLKKTIG